MIRFDGSISVDDPTNRLLGLFDVPAYARRGMRVEQGRETIRQHCAGKRRGMLRWVEWRLRELRGAAPDRRRLVPLLAEASELEKLADLWEQFGSRPLRYAQPVSLRRCRRMLRDTCLSIERFNTRWRAFLVELDLTALNREIEAYNRYYLLEKECAMRSARLARRGYKPLNAASVDELLEQFPLLPVPRPAERR